jgi:hypothetical protein
VSFSNSIASCLQRAVEWKTKYEDHYVSIEHLLLAAAENQGFSQQLFRELLGDDSVKQLQTCIDAIRGNNKVTSRTPENAYEAGDICSSTSSSDDPEIVRDEGDKDDEDDDEDDEDEDDEDEDEDDEVDEIDEKNLMCDLLLSYQRDNEAGVYNRNSTALLLQMLEKWSDLGTQPGGGEGSADAGREEDEDEDEEEVEEEEEVQEDKSEDDDDGDDELRKKK